ncbi:MAG: beta-carotene 15,15'-monooxygenase [Bergeyella sp.]
MPEFDIDNFKVTWQKQDVKPKYDSAEILQMLNRKSRNYVKYILWISIAEFLLIVGVSAFYLCKGDEGESFMHILQKLGVTETPELKNSLNYFYNSMKAVSILVTAYFVVRFYISYSKINVEANLKKFILQIMRFKNTVNLFILTNILLLVVYTGALAVFMFYVLSGQHVKLDTATIWGFVVGLAVSLVFSIVLIWVYYRIVYGIIMNRLGKNMEQLQEIEGQSE